MKITKKQKAKLVKEQSRKHAIPPNKKQEPKTTYKRNKRVDPEE